MAKICQAMIDAGIEDPESQEGKDFCVKKCPYPNGCIVFEDRVKPTTLKRLENVRKAKELQAEGLTVGEIAKRLNKAKRTIDGYLD